MPEDGDQAPPEERVAKMSGKERVAFYSNGIYKRYKSEDPQKLLVCLSTLRVYCANAKDNPTDSKKENAAFKSRVLPFEGSLELLNACGFKDQAPPRNSHGSSSSNRIAVTAATRKQQQQRATPPAATAAEWRQQDHSDSVFSQTICAVFE
ncbi:hypothetical protein Emag_002976 [Eimeria magna]